ncbi:MAG: ABC transporter ATP-binding protein [Deltaproteobacteria bacterium]|nr:ABC transporter ATP-binding protein [Deltaproteobacteria bacterium]
MKSDILLDIENLRTYFFIRGGVLKAVDDVSLVINEGETLGLVGESGCGKSITASSIMGLIPKPSGKIVGGSILFNGVDLVKLPESRMKKLRGCEISMIFQEPMTSLNPVYKVGDQVGESIRLHQKLNRKEAKEKTIHMFDLVGIPDPRIRINEYPHQMSGGMRQRVMIAMALGCNPRLMIADEPTTALDVTIQAQIIDLMNKLKEEVGSSILFITHDLGVIAEVAQNVAVMYAGKIVEYADVETLYSKPKHPYTIGLMNSIPKLNNSRMKRLHTIKGVVPSLFNLAEGCAFYERCPDAEKHCVEKTPELKAINAIHKVRCFKYE